MRGCIAISGFQRSINVLLHGRLSGVRCGFLGLLHMDVFRQRLEHEYQVALPPWPQGPSDCPLRDLGRARVAAGRGMPAPRARAPPALSDTDARPEPSTLPARLERRVGAAGSSESRDVPPVEQHGNRRGAARVGGFGALAGPGRCGQGPTRCRRSCRPWGISPCGILAGATAGQDTPWRRRPWCVAPSAGRPRRRT